MLTIIVDTEYILNVGRLSQINIIRALKISI